MSKLSHSVTFLLPHMEAAALVEARSTHWSAIPPGTGTGTDDLFLYASSRNNHMEYALRELVRAFPFGGLSYLRSWDEVINSPPWLAALHGVGLSSAIDGLRAMLDTLREQPAKCSVLIHQGADPAFELDVKDALAVPEPQAFKAALELYRENRQRNEGDDAGSLVSFLRAHMQLLQEAQNRGHAAIYGLWI